MRMKKKLIVIIVFLGLSCSPISLILAATSGQGEINVGALVPTGAIGPLIPSLPIGGTPMVYDLIPPIISDIEIIELERDSVRIKWKTNELSVPKIHYGKTSNYGEEYIGKSFSLENSILLKDLLPDIIYHFKITAIDRDGNRSSQEVCRGD